MEELPERQPEGEKTTASGGGDAAGVAAGAGEDFGQWPELRPERE